MIRGFARRAALRAAVAGRDVHLAAEDRLDAALSRLVVEGDRREHVAVLGDGQRRHLQLDRAVEQLLDPARAVEQRVLRVQMQVDEVVIVTICLLTGCPTAHHNHRSNPPRNLPHFYSHSIVAGGFELMSYTTRLMPLHFVDDARRDRREQLVRQARPVGRHAVAALDGADRDRVLVGALVAHHADALHRQQHGERLPQPPVPAGALHFVRDDRVGAAHQSQARLGDLAEDPHGQAGTGERLPPDELVVEPELLADGAHFVLEQLPQRLDQLEPHALGQPADVVVALDHVRRPDDRHALDHVRIERALREEVERARASRPRASNTSMNAAPMIFRFCSGSVTPARRSRNRRRGVDEDERQAQALEPLPGSAPLRPAAAGRCRRRCTSADRRSPGG